MVSGRMRLAYTCVRENMMSIGVGYIYAITQGV